MTGSEHATETGVASATTAAEITKTMPAAQLQQQQPQNGTTQQPNKDWVKTIDKLDYELAQKGGHKGRVRGAPQGQVRQD